MQKKESITKEVYRKKVKELCELYGFGFQHSHCGRVKILTFDDRWMLEFEGNGDNCNQVSLYHFSCFKDAPGVYQKYPDYHLQMHTKESPENLMKYIKCHKKKWGTVESIGIEFAGGDLWQEDMVHTEKAC